MPLEVWSVLLLFWNGRNYDLLRLLLPPRNKECAHRGDDSCLEEALVLGKVR